MTLEELENTLPNGLHDSEVQRVTVDYRQRTLTLELEVFVGSVEDTPELREAYRSGRIEIAGLLFVVMEPPDSRYPFAASAELTIDGCDMSKNLDSQLMKSLPDDAFFRSIWVNEWNAFIHIAAKNAEFFWNEGTKTVYRSHREHFLPGETIN